MYSFKIKTFISKYLTEDTETIAEVLKYSPDRIDKDNWISQARELVEEQQ